MPESQVIQIALDQERYARDVIEEAMSDKAFMADVQEAQQSEQDGDKGLPWSEVKVRLGLV